VKDRVSPFAEYVTFDENASSFSGEAVSALP
jgi:hypothetical protein